MRRNLLTGLSLYLVANKGDRTLDDFFDIILKAVEGGVNIIQLREKEASDKEIINLAKELQSLLKPFNVPLIINDRVELAHVIKADGVHLGQSDMKISDARALLGKEAIIGLSVETLEQVVAANKEDVDYIAASPVFATNTKSDCSAPWGLEGLQELCSISHHPVVAIGRINESNASQIFAHGAHGVAIVSAIFNAPCPKTAAEGIKRYVQKLE